MQRVLYFDILRIVAICAVVLLHTSAGFLDDYNSSPFSYFIGDVYDSLTRWCVPVFVMVSGALLLNTNKQETLADFFKKRTTKVVIPFLIWTFVYILYRHYHDDKVFTFSGTLKDFFDSNIYFHLWFMYMIIGLYLVTPIFKVYVSHAKRENILYFIILWFIASFIPLVNNLFGLNIQYVFETVSGYIGFFILGYYLHHYGLSTTARKLIYLFALISLFITIFGTLFLTIRDTSDFNDVLYDYFRPNTIIVASAVFLFFKHLNLESKRNKIIFLLSNISFGVYLIHPILRDVVYHFIDVESHPLVDIPLVTGLTIVLSFTVVYIMSKVPLLKNIVP
ncbi:surface polysaccharide O-acyltransferase-like enzyme [Scopulibacillus daqui]|uniref:Surface polysaccharide O-acyltransferase-like enzyme n=1 Tax=Scopulibacillus daqui TaxID=1469162 RepID=A0ABS2PYG7_9BACL|nr:acyltransferase family protein [Scopulibacillus daqui]MBM7645062.1 surface polysaccharide O-acyltransferase-like enzyme [Scopulibacillus daqui]